MHKNDSVRLRHMLDAAREAVGFADGRTRDDLDSDRMLQLSLVRLLEIIGVQPGQFVKPRAAAIDACCCFSYHCWSRSAGADWVAEHAAGSKITACPGDGTAATHHPRSRLE